MEKLTLDQFKTDTKGKGSRLSLDQFKSQNSNNVNNQELEKLTGGILGACHTASYLEVRTLEAKQDGAAFRELVNWVKSWF